MTAASQLPPPSGGKPVRQVHTTGERGSVKKEGIQGKGKEKNGAEESWDEWQGGRGFTYAWLHRLVSQFGLETKQELKFYPNFICLP